MILNFDVGANVSLYDPGFCCLPSAFARAQHSVVLPSLSHFTLNKKQVFMMVIVQSARIAGFCGNFTPLPSPGGSIKS